MDKRPSMVSTTFVKSVNVPGRYGDGRGCLGLTLLVKPGSRPRCAPYATLQNAAGWRVEASTRHQLDDSTAFLPSVRPEAPESVTVIV